MLKEVPNVKLPPEYALKITEGMNDGNKATFQFINGDFGVDEYWKRLERFLSTKMS